MVVLLSYVDQSQVLVIKVVKNEKISLEKKERNIKWLVYFMAMD